MSKILLFILVPFVLQQYCIGRDEEGSMLVQLDDCTCLGYTQTFQCTVFGGGLTIWKGSAFSDCEQFEDEIRLRHSQYTSQATGQCNDGTIVATSTDVSGNCYTSQLSVTVRQEIINETIECIRAMQNTTRVGQRVLSLTQVPYPPPSDVHVEAIERSRIVFAWNKTIGAQCSSVQYIITSVNCGACPNTTIDTNITCVEFSVRNHTCMFAVQTEICGYLVGPRSEYLIVNLFVPSPPKFKLRLYYSSEYAHIETIFNKANMTISDNIDGSPISYNITYSDFASGRICGTFNVPATVCQNGVCHHKSQIASPCSPNEDIAVSILSTNILGSGPPSQPVVFSLVIIAENRANDQNLTNSTDGVFETTCEQLLLRVAAGLSTLVIITLIVIVITVFIFMVVTVKLSRDKANLKQTVKAIPLEQNLRGAEKEQPSCSGDYEDVDAYKASDININENAAYSKITDL